MANSVSLESKCLLCFNIFYFVQHLTSEIVYHRPIDPLNYMLEELQRMKDAREKQAAETSQ